MLSLIEQQNLQENRKKQRNGGHKNINSSSDLYGPAKKWLKKNDSKKWQELLTWDSTKRVEEAVRLY